MLQLGLPASVPVPVEEDEADLSPAARKRSGVDKAGPNKAKRGGGAANIALTYEDMKDLLAQQSASILQANREHAQSLLDALERKHGDRLDRLDAGVSKVTSGLEGLEAKVAALERDLRAGSRLGSEDSAPDKRRYTLVFGGWEQDTKKGRILQELQQALAGLELEDHLSDRPFTTGPRKSVALLNFPLRAGESDEDRRSRMHELVLTISQSKVLTSAGKKLWCSYSKTKQQRDISGHCSWVKRSLAQIDERVIRELDVEYATGSVWLGDSLVASATRACNDGAKSDFTITGRGSPPAWVDLERLARESRLSVSELRQAFEAALLAGKTATGQAEAATGSPGASFVRDSRVEDEGCVNFDVFGWNLGGCKFDCISEVMAMTAKRKPRMSDVWLVQELPRRRQGWTTDTIEKFTVVSHRAKDQWRGAGILFDGRCWALLKRIPRQRGVWVQLKCLATGQQMWFGTFHFTPGCSHAVYSQEVQDFFAKTPRDGLPVVVQGDANSRMGWTTRGASVEAFGGDSKGSFLLGVLQEAGLDPCSPVPAQRNTPTSRPRQEGRAGNQIDLFAQRRTRHHEIRIHRDSYSYVGTDHDLLQGSFALRGRGRWAQHATAPRVWIGGPTEITKIDQGALEQLAKTCTRVRAGVRYRDTAEVKVLFRRAKQSKTSQSWKQALAARRAARRQWEAERLQRASQGDWQAYRAYSKQANPGWDHNFADAQRKDPHEVVHEHLKGIFQGPGLPPVSPLRGDCRAFDVEELSLAVGQLKLGKSVGLDLTSTELLRALVDIEGGRVHLLEYLNGVFVKQEVPRAWNKPLLILLPKVSAPLGPKDLRPIALGSSTSKLYARMVINRIQGMLDHTSPAQCAGRGRQATDVLFTVNRMFQLDQEWKQGLCAIKIDISKAFDSVNRAQMMVKIQERIGDTFELRALRALLTNTEATLQSAWGCSTFDMGSGIKQGAIESPVLFSFLMDVALSEASTRHDWGSRPKLFGGLEEEELLYMDDGILWGRDCEGVGRRLEEFSEVLRGYGLHLNLGKCRLYCSPFHLGARMIKVKGQTLRSENHLEVMGVKLAVGQPITLTLQPLLARARAKFWSISHLLRAKSSVKARTKLMDRVITNTGLWCISAFPPEPLGLQMVNCFQFILMGWLLKLGKRHQETWLDFRRRVVRSSRVALVNSQVDRWSTQWLRKWWGYAGHRVRALLRPSPPISSLVDSFRSLPWWNAEKRKPDGLRHPARFYARLMATEAKMDRACGGDDIPESLLEDARAWALYTEEGMLLEYLEGVCDFNVIRQWNEVLEQWLWDAKDEIQQLVEDFTLIVSNVVDRLEVELDLGAGEPISQSREGQTAECDESEEVDVDITSLMAVQLWLLWLGITDDQNASPPGKLLPGFVEEVVTQSFLSYGAQDRLTLALGFTRLVQSLMTAIGRLMEQASCMDNTPRANAEQADDEEVEVEAESDETLMMQTSMDYEVTSFMQASDNEWYRLLQQLRASLEQQSKSALRENIMWLRRLIHYKCVDSTRGHLLGLLGGRAGELVALLAAAETAAGEVEAPRSMHYTKWCIEWWDKLSPHLQQARGSLAAMGRPPLNCDLPPVFRATGLPDSADEEDADTAEFKSPTDEEGMPGNTSGPVSGLPRGPPPAVPVSELPTDLVVRSLLSSAARANRDTGAGAHLRQPGPIVVESQPPQPSSPTSFELTAAAEAAEEREALARVQAEEEQIEDAFYERQIASFQATRAQEWDDWALFDAMQNPPKKRTRILQVTVQGGASSSTVQVPLSSDRAEIRLQVELGYASGDADTTQTTIPAAVEGGMPMGSAGSHWNAIEALGPEQLHNVYEQWARGDLSSETVSREYGPVVLEALQTEHLLFMRGLPGSHASAGPLTDTCIDEGVDG
ncbi:unnamed protein product [Symbiodinium microadriaticum]|nr:unnamed protein product [Symbiodinium microadriaticum]